MALQIGAAYVRVSTDDQLEYSPDSQIKLIREHAKRDGVVIPEEYVYTDGGISGKSAEKRPQFRLMIATAKQDPPPFTAIYVWKFSRFARNQEEAIMYKNLLKKRGVDVVSISEPSSDSPFSSLIERIIEWMDEYYVINLAEEVRRGMKEKSLRGEAMGRAPFGYDVKDKILVPNEDAPFVREIFTQFADGASFRDIATRHPQLTSQAVRYILSNPAYIGKTRWDDEEHAPYRAMDYVADISDMPDGKHEAIIDADLWEKVQAKLSARPTWPKYSRAGHEEYLFKGLVRCGSCGGTLCRMTGRGSKEYLQCHKYSRGYCKVSHYIQSETLLRIVIDQLEQSAASGEFSFSAPSVRAQDDSEEKWSRYIANEKTRLQRAKKAYLDGYFTEKEYADIKSESESAIAQYEMMRKPKQYDTKTLKAKTMDVISVLRSDASPALKNRALRSILDRIVFNKPENTIDIFFAISFQ